MKKWFKEKGLDLIKGLAIGVAFIIPGVSGGTMAVILGIYDKIINAVNKLAKKFVESIRVLLPIAIGAVLAILICWYPFKLAFEHIMLVMVSLFAGFILGGMPGIIDEVRGVKIKPIYIVATVIAIILSIALGVLSVLMKLNIQSFYDSRPWWLYILVILAGIVSSFALVMPGISGSMILMVLGFYTPTLNLIDNFLSWTNVGPSISILACLVIGVVIGVVIASKIMAYLLSKFRIGTFYAIIGIIIGSLVAIYYNFEINEYYLRVGFRWWEILLSVAALVGGVIVSYMFVRFSRKEKSKTLTEVKQ
ncbi:MAG: DUF368 domain-containing protein [Bacteroidia bacterium]|nr:DUF368 domain-containing protein [Bacteroidia bacterium]